MTSSEEKVKKELLRFLTKFEKKYPTINAGGCAVFASALGGVLGAWFPVRVRVLEYYSEEGNSLDEARKTLPANTVRAWNARGIDFNHLVLEVDFTDGRYLAEVAQLKPVSDFYFHHESCLLEGSLTVEEARQLGARKHGWNEKFDRKSIPNIRKDFATLQEKLAKFF